MQKTQKKQLKNGITILFAKRSTDSVVINISINVGSNNEDDTNMGISHFLEHMVFEGTTDRDAKTIANEIESIGGEINAATSSERTIYYIKVLKKHFPKAVSILSDILQNSLFEEKTIDKERKVILDEVNMVNDEPRFYQWIMFQKALFPKPLSNPTYGTVKIVKKVKRKDLINYYKKNYVGKNMVISIAGNVKNPFNLIEKSFNKINLGQKAEIKIKNHEKSPIKEIRPILQSYMVMGYKTAPCYSNDSIVLDVIQAHLGRGQSGKLFEEIRIKRGLAYDLGCYHASEKHHNFFAFYASTSKEKIIQIKKIIFDEIKNLEKINKKDLEDAKSYIEGKFKLENEDNHEFADTLCYFEQSSGNSKDMLEYVKKIKRVTAADIKKIVKKYFSKKPVEIIIEQKK